MAGVSQTQTLGFSYDEDEPEPWGRLCPSSASMPYPVIELTADEMSFGRDLNQCDYELTEPQISSFHAKIVRNTASRDSHCATVYDFSTNGTYLNKRKIGKKKSSLLFDGDEITFISYCKQDKKTNKERKKVSFLFYKNRNLDLIESSEHSIYNKYDLRTTLGTGSFAVVKLGICRETGDRFAVKEIDKKKYELKQQNKQRTTSNIMNEANILQQIDHQNIIKVYDVFDEEHTLFIVLEIAFGGELFQRIIDHKKLTENTARYIMKQLLDAIMYLHDNKIAHRDLKPENILMKDRVSWDIKITDFGLSRLLLFDNEMLTTMCGTPLFLAPEVLSSKKRGGYGFECDYWSIGVILYLMLVGHPPYNEKEGNLLELVKNGKFSFPKKTWNEISIPAKDLVVNLMQIDVKKRFNGQQTMNHKWMKMENKDNKKKRNYEQQKQEYDEKEFEREPARKKYKNANGKGVDTDLMSGLENLKKKIWSLTLPTL